MLISVCPDSLDGEVKLWDIRGGDAPLQTWDLFPHGLSTFDVHEQTEVFAAYVMLVSDRFFHCVDKFTQYIGAHSLQLEVATHRSALLGVQESDWLAYSGANNSTSPREHDAVHTKNEQSCLPPS